MGSIYEHVFHRSDMAGALAALAAAHLERTKAGARHVLKVPVVRELRDDPRLLAIAQEFVGPTRVAFRATLFDKSPAANWFANREQRIANSE